MTVTRNCFGIEWVANDIQLGFETFDKPLQYYTHQFCGHTRALKSFLSNKHKNMFKVIFLASLYSAAVLLDRQNITGVCSNIVVH